MAGSDRGTTETIGAILLTVVTVTSVSIAGGALLQQDMPTERPQTAIDASVTDGVLSVEHAGGEVISASAVEFVLFGSAQSFRSTDRLDAAANDTTFGPGDVWHFSLDQTTTAEEVGLVYLGDERVLVATDGIDSSQEWRTGPSPMPPTENSSDPAEKETTTRAGGSAFEVSTFTVKDVSNNNEIRVKTTYNVTGEYDSIQVGLYRAGEDDVVDREPSGLAAWFVDEPYRDSVILKDDGRESGQYTVVLWIHSNGGWSSVTRDIDAQRKGTVEDRDDEGSDKDDDAEDEGEENEGEGDSDVDKGKGPEQGIHRENGNSGKRGNPENP